jgi:hypothetical protein
MSQVPSTPAEILRRAWRSPQLAANVPSDAMANASENAQGTARTCGGADTRQHAPRDRLDQRGRGDRRRHHGHRSPELAYYCSIATAAPSPDAPLRAPGGGRSHRRAAKSERHRPSPGPLAGGLALIQVVALDAGGNAGDPVDPAFDLLQVIVWPGPSRASRSRARHPSRRRALEGNPSTLVQVRARLSVPSELTGPAGSSGRKR